MASIMDQIFQGVIPYTQNEAIQSLASIFGEQMLGVGGTSSRIVTLSAALNPIYLGFLFMILAYIGVSGVVRTAMDGKFLGRQWSGFGVPAMFILCVVLLSPVPTQNSATLGQVIFVKGLKIGSNAGDYTLMKVFDQSQAEAITYNLAAEHIPQVNDQMKGAFVMYMCVNQLNQMGYGTKVNYFLLLNKVCGIPADMVGLYADYFSLGDSASVGKINSDISKWSSLTGITLPPQVLYNPSNAVGYTKNMTAVSKQLQCHFNQFDTYFRTPVPANIAAASKISTINPVNRVLGPNNSPDKPTQLSSTILKYNTPQISAMWAPALNASYKCVLNPVILGSQDAAKADFTTTPDMAVPWRSGWSNAALAISDELDTYKTAMGKGKLPLSMEVITTPNANVLGDSLTDKKNQALLASMLVDLQEFTSGINNSPDQASQVLSNVLSTATSGTALDWSRVAATVLLPVALTNTANMNAAGPATAANAAKLKKVGIFMDSLVGKTATFAPAALGKIAATGAALFSKVGKALETWQKKDRLVADVGSLPGIGMAAKVVNGVANVFMPGPTTVMVLSIFLLAVNVVVLLPQVILLIVKLIWMTKAAVWYFIIPVATVLIALPNTRVGHDIWKSALAIILTPFLALIFYVVSLFIFDQMYASVIYWIFQPILSSFTTGIWSGLGSILMQVMTGEIIFRFLAGVGVIIATTVYMSMLILRGPDLITGTLGLKGSSGDLGEEFNSLRHRLDPTSRMRGMGH